MVRDHVHCARCFIPVVLPRGLWSATQTWLCSPCWERKQRENEKPSRIRRAASDAQRHLEELCLELDAAGWELEADELVALGEAQRIVEKLLREAQGERAEKL